MGFGWLPRSRSARIMLSAWTIVSLVIALAALGYALAAYREIMRRSPGSEKMQEIARAIQEGGRAFLHAEYRWLAVFVVVVLFVLLFVLVAFALHKPTGG